jgi:hypothetical protein
MWRVIEMRTLLFICFTLSQQLNDASKFLLESAASLGTMVKSEQDFWDEALEMRRKSWLIQTGNAAQSLPGASGERSFYVQYGFGDGKLCHLLISSIPLIFVLTFICCVGVVGSKFREPTYAEMTRAYDKSSGDEQHGAVQMLIPHTVRRHVVARLVESHIAGLDLNFDYSEKQLSSKAGSSTTVDEDCKLKEQRVYKSACTFWV